MTNDSRTHDSLRELAKEMRSAATAVAEMVGSFDDLVERRTTERVNAELVRIRADHDKVIAQLEETMIRSSQRSATQLNALRGKLAAITRRYERAAAVLRQREPDAAWPALSGVDGEPPASDPASQIRHWLAQLAQPWPASRMLFLRGELAVTTNLEGDAAGPDPEIMSDYDGGEQVVPVGALIEIARLVADAPAGETAKDLRERVRNMMIGHGLAAFTDPMSEAPR